jgi:predicted permease
MRLALGAGRLRLVRQLLTESILLAALSGILGIALAYWGTQLASAFLKVPATPLEIVTIDSRMDLGALAFTGAVSLLSALFFGLAPAFRYTRWSAAQSVVRAGDRNPALRSRFSRSLLVLQFAMSVILLTGAGLFVRTLGNLRNADVGFDPNNLLLFRVSPGTLHYDDAQTGRLYDDILQRVDALPGVLQATISQFPLVSDSGTSSFIFIPGGESKEPTRVRTLRVRPNFLETMKIPVRLGRDFAPADDVNGPRVALINETLAREHFPNTNPIGHRLGLDSPDTSGDFEVIGVVPDVPVSSLQRPIPPTVYLSQLQQSPPSTTFLVRTADNPISVVPLIRETVSRIDPLIPLTDIRTQAQQIENGFAIELLLARVSTAFGIMALLLASVGLYGLMSHNVTGRVPEIGVRIALGARRGQVIRMIMVENLSLILIGVVLGMAGAHAVTRLIRSMLYGLEPNDPVTITVVLVLLIATAAAAAFLPARAASQVDPLAALRHE